MVSIGKRFLLKLNAIEMDLLKLFNVLSWIDHFDGLKVTALYQYKSVKPDCNSN